MTASIFDQPSPKLDLLEGLTGPLSTPLLFSGVQRAHLAVFTHKLVPPVPEIVV